MIKIEKNVNIVIFDIDKFTNDENDKNWIVKKTNEKKTKKKWTKKKSKWKKQKRNQ